MTKALVILWLGLVSLTVQAQTWYKVAVQDQTVTAKQAFTYRFGALPGTPLYPGTTGALCSTVGGCWGTPGTPTPDANGVYSVFVNPAKLGNPAINTPKELDVLETTTSQNLTVDGVAVVVPALVAAATGGCPQGVFAEIAANIEKQIAQIPTGTVYVVAPSTDCITATDGTTVDMSQGNLLILRTSVDQVITLTNPPGQLAPTTFVTIKAVDGTVTPTTIPVTINPASVSVVVNNRGYTCTASNNQLVCIQQ